MSFLLSPLLSAYAPPAAGQVAPVENRALRSAIDAQGNLWAVWEADDGTDTDIQYSRWNGSGWQPSRPLSADPGAWERSPSLAVDANGTLWAAWSRGTAPAQVSIWVSQWQTFAWSPPVQVPGTAALVGGEPVLAPTPDGGLWLAWVGHDGTDREIFVSRWKGTAWSAPQRIGNDDAEPQAYDTHPALAVDGNGSAWLVWTSYESLFNDGIHASHWDGLAWSPQQPVSSNDDTPDAWPSIALDAEGLPWIAWHGVASDGTHPWRIFASHWDPAESAWDAETLVSSPADVPLDEQHPSLALDVTGQMHLAWAISGQFSGIAHTAWDATNWASPHWTQTDQPSAGSVQLVGKEPAILWVAPVAGQEVPLHQEPVDELREPVPQALPSRSESTIRTSTPIPNRHLAHGDSITRGAYPNVTGEPSIPYPTTLDGLLDSNTGDSEVINWGRDGEKARAALDRIRLGVQTYTPQFVQILEGTNDVSNNYSAAETSFAVRNLILEAKNESGVSGVQVIVGTLPPRRDDKNPLTYETNQQIIAWAVRPAVNAPVADIWQAFYNYGPWESFYIDKIHPGTTGLQIIAQTFFQRMADVGWIVLDGIPPTAWISSLPTTSECANVSLSWDGQDPAPGTGIKSFDVQVSENSSTWANWLLATATKSGTYTTATTSSKLYFRVRARDWVDNLGVYSAAKSTTVVDTRPPDTLHLYALPPAQKPPFALSWWGADACSSSLTYDLEVRVGTSAWTSWLSNTPDTQGVFNPPAPMYGQLYSFHVRARDKAGNVSAWSDPISTLLAEHTIEGEIVTARHQPVIWPQVTVPGALVVESDFGQYTAYLAGDGDYNLQAGRDGFGTLPPMHLTAVNTSLSGADFVLPPLDNIIQDGGFESGNLNAWQVGGTPPTLVAGHTGTGSARLGGGAGVSSLSQSLTLPTGLTNATLSFLVKLDGTSGGNSIQVDLAGTSLSWTAPVSPGGWTHVWYDVGDALGRPVTLTFTVSGSPAVLLDEVSLGSAASGGGRVFMPIVARSATP